MKDLAVAITFQDPDILNNREWQFRRKVIFTSLVTYPMPQYGLSRRQCYSVPVSFLFAFDPSFSTSVCYILHEAPIV